MSGPAEAAAVVLAGGFSRRFSGDKSRFVWRDRPLIEHVCATAARVCSEVIIVVRPEQRLEQWPSEFIVGDDPALPPGPLRGIIAGLEAVSHEYAFITACDTPALQAQLIAGVLQRLQCQASRRMPVVPQWANRLQPLLAGFPRSSAAALRDLAENGEQSPLAALQQIDHEVISESACRQLDPGGLSFVNVNSPDDLGQLDVLS